jgi:hypothetical protein
MTGIDPRVIKHEIRTYPDAKPIQKKIQPVNPHKEVTIKVEVEKLIKVGFIYRIQLTKWVQNLVPINKNQGMIRVCMDFCDLNKACLETNFPIPFIDQIIYEFACCEFFSFIDGFSWYNQI